MAVSRQSKRSAGAKQRGGGDWYFDGSDYVRLNGRNRTLGVLDSGEHPGPRAAKRAAKVNSTRAVERAALRLQRIESMRGPLNGSNGVAARVPLKQRRGGKAAKGGKAKRAVDPAALAARERVAKQALTEAAASVTYSADQRELAANRSRAWPAVQQCPGLDKRENYKARGRQSMCRKLEVTGAPRWGGRFPMLWSQELVRSRPLFRNEQPFPSRKFEPFLAQLPALSSLAGKWTGGCDRCDTCAVVGASGSLLARRHGRLIDAHEVVLRPNWLHIKGFEHVVGSRTNLNLFFGVEGMIEQFDVAMRKLPPERRAIGVVTPASDRSVASYFRHMARTRKNETFGRSSGQHVYLLSDDVYHSALAHLCDATGGGCAWRKPTARMRPSTGFFSVVLALQMCRKVSLFGLTSDPCQAAPPPPPGPCPASP